MREASPLSPRAEEAMTRVIGCAMAVHKALGPGLYESIYARAMWIEMEAQGLPYEAERSLRVTYRGIEIPGQRVDLIVDGEIVVELKDRVAIRLDPCRTGTVLSPHDRSSGRPANQLPCPVAQDGTEAGGALNPSCPS